MPRTNPRSTRSGWNLFGTIFAMISMAAALACSGKGSSGTGNTNPDPPPAAATPTITTQPQNQSVTAGQTATFSVIASGTAPLTYQWMKGATDISGATANSYTTPVTTTADNGASFTVTVTNGTGHVDSNAATLTVSASGTAPIITTQPQSQSVTAGQTATFSVVASGTAPLTYQWMKGGVTIGGATSSSYTTPVATASDDGSTYSVQVGNSGGSVTSSSAPLTVQYTISDNDPSLASRTSGVAPLLVNFDVISAMHVTPPELVNGRREYADTKYAWDFGDSNAGNWATSGLPKNKETGYVAAHVYETPGAYTVTLNITTPSGSTEQHHVQITVSDPEVIYAGTNTTCISTGTDFTGAPTGSQHVTTSNFADFANYIGAGKRLLLRRGDSWTAGSTVYLNTNGPTTVGAFGAPFQPDRFAICANAPTLNASGTSNAQIFRVDNSTDLRVMDLKFVGGPTENSAIYGTTEIYQNLFMRLVIDGFVGAVSNQNFNTRDFTGIALVSCEVHHQDSTGVYLGGVQLSLLGNEIKDIVTSHVVRLWQAHRSVLSHNEISGSSLQSNMGRHALKLHGPKENLITMTGGGHIANRTQYVVINNNLFGSSGPWPVCMGPQDAISDERLSDVLFERNRIYPAFGTASSLSLKVSVAVRAAGRNMTVRNNLFSGVGDDEQNGFWAVMIEQTGIEPVGLNNRIYNNTVYLPVANPLGNAVFAVSTAINTTVQNNLVQMPAAAQSGPLLQDQGQGTVADHNLLTPNAGFVDPANSNPLLTDFSLTAQSPAINAGAVVPVYDDFAGNPRPIGAGYDLGAFERP